MATIQILVNQDAPLVRRAIIVRVVMRNSNALSTNGVILKAVAVLGLTLTTNMTQHRKHLVQDAAPDSILIQVQITPAQFVQRGIHVQQQMTAQVHTQDSNVMIILAHRVTITTTVQQDLHTTRIQWFRVLLGIIAMITQVQELLHTRLRQSATTESTSMARVVLTAQLDKFVSSDTMVIELASQVVTTPRWVLVLSSFVPEASLATVAQTVPEIILQP